MEYDSLSDCHNLRKLAYFDYKHGNVVVVVVSKFDPGEPVDVDRWVED